VKTGDPVTKDQLLVKVMRPEISDIDFLIDETKEEIEKLYENKEKNGKVIKKLENKLKLLNEKKSILSEIKSPVRGKILDIIVKPGNIVKEYDTIAIIEPLDETVEAIIYIPLSTGKKIEPTMEVQISPAIARRDLYGFISGKIKSVDIFPETRESMMKVIGNEELVNMFLSYGPSMEIHVELPCDVNTESGFKWSSGRGGPPFKICSGTLCRGTVILKKIHPVNLLFPSTE
jgi:HlyD family secretion protein